MKFGKNLQKVVDISDPEWAPYWTNYKMLKKLIKELPTLVPIDEKLKPNQNATSTKETESTTQPLHPGSPDSTLAEKESNESSDGSAEDPKLNQLPRIARANPARVKIKLVDQKSAADAMGKSPGEIAFFKLLHSEFKKSCCFFKNAEEEMAIREARVQEGNEIMQRPNSIMVNDRWSLLSKSLYRLYKDLLLLETYAIMTYVTFSKILKKHDKMTGFSTRNKFMGNVVSKANFTTYPKLIGMIKRTEALYEEVSSRLVTEGKDSLYEDERLFINMIHRLNNQALENEDAPLTRPRQINTKEESNESTNEPDMTHSITKSVGSVGSVASSLQSLVEDNETDKKNLGNSISTDAVPGLEYANQNTFNSNKREAVNNEECEKRQRLE